MENWGTLILVNIFLAITIGVITNLITPWVQTTYQKSVFSSKQKRIEAAIKEYKDRRRTHSTPALITPFVLLPLFLKIAAFIGVVSGYFFLLSVLGLMQFLYSLLSSSIMGGLFAGLGIALTVSLIQTSLLINDFLYFDKYRERVKSKLIKLGGNPEEIDRADKEFEAEKQNKP